MKILYITPVFQHPKVRGSTRCYFFGRELAKRHDVTMLSLKRNNIAPEALADVQSFLRLFLFDAQPKTTAKGFMRKIQATLSDKNAIREMSDKLRELTRNETFDAVLFHGKSVFPVINSFTNLPIVIDFCDATTMRIRDRMRQESPVMRLMLNKRLSKFNEIEQQLIAKTPHVAFISCRDRDAVMQQRPGIRIVPNGVDLQFWERRSNTPRNNCIVFTGVMDYRPNAEAAHYLIDELLPLLRDRVPDIEILIVGRDPSKSLREKAEKHPQVTVTGFVEDVRDYLEQASVFVAPIPYASGVQNKVLEAFSMKMPVLCSSAVAAGLHFEDGEKPPVRVADDPEMFANSLIDLLNDDATRAKMAAAGRDFVERRFVWGENVNIFETMLENAIAEFKAETATNSKP